MTKIAKDDPILAMLASTKEYEIIPLIKKYLAIKPNIGIYKVYDCYKPKDRYFHPSTDTDRCMRWLYYDKTIMREEQHSPQTLITFKIGHAIHAMVEYMLADMAKLGGFFTANGAEFKISDEICRGSLDFVLTFDGDDKPTIIEIKTMNGHQFSRLNSPKAKHLEQTRIYMDKLDTDNAIIVYVSKEYPHDMKEFRVKRTNVDYIYDRWNQVREAIALEEPELAPKVTSEKDKNCTYCPYTKECWE